MTTETTTTETTTESQAAQTETGTVDFRSGLSDDLKGLHPEIKDVNGLMKSYSEAVKMQGRSVALPEANDSDGFRKVMSRLGMPETADKYDFTAAGEVSESIAGAFRPIAHELGLTQKQAEGLAKWNNDMGAKLAEEAFNSGQEALKKDWQNKYDENVGKAQTFFKGIAADVDGADAFLAKFGDDPAVVRMFHSMAVKFGEGGVMGGAGNDAQLTVSQIDEQIAKIRGDADYKNLMSPRYNELDKELQALYRKKVAAAA